MTDTGSEFALLMCQITGGVVKDLSALLKEVTLLLYNNKIDRERYLLSSFDFEKLAKETKEFSAITIDGQDLEMFKTLAEKSKFEHIAPKNGDSDKVLITFNKDKTDILNDIMLKIQQYKLKKVEFDDKEEGIKDKVERLKSLQNKDSVKEDKNTGNISKDDIMLKIQQYNKVERLKYEQNKEKTTKDEQNKDSAKISKIDKNEMER